MTLFIIFGTRGVTLTAASGQFNCPECGAQRDYAHRRVRRFFTLYFIPLIPLDRLGEYIECRSCSNTFRMSVLEWRPQSSAQSFEAEFHAAIRHVMVQMMLADGNIDEAEVATIQDIYSKLAKHELSRADIDLEALNVRADTRDLKTYLKSVAGRLNDHGKELVIKSAYLVAAADGKFEEQERKLLAEIADAIELSPAHFKGVLAELQKDA
jgi:tellurite resistance protein